MTRSASEQLPEGKIPPRVLREVLRRLGGGAGLDPGPASGEDAAVAAAGSEPRIVLAADPITFPSADPGWHAVIVNANDVAATGGEPRWFLSSILLPPGTDAARAVRIADGIRRGCREVGAVPAGGHTEVTAAVRHEVVAGAMIGVAQPGAREAERRGSRRRPARDHQGHRHRGHRHHRNRIRRGCEPEIRPGVPGPIGPLPEGSRNQRRTRSPHRRARAGRPRDARCDGRRRSDGHPRDGEAAGLGAIVEEAKIPHFDESSATDEPLRPRHPRRHRLRSAPCRLLGGRDGRPPPSPGGMPASPDA